MPKPIQPLRSESQPGRQDIQFKDFGVLNDGSHSKTSVFTSLTLNALLLIIAVILGAAAKKTLDRQKLENLTYVSTIKPEPPKPLPPKIVPPRTIPRPPEIKLVQPTIIRPEVKLEAPKPVPMKPMETPKPFVAPAPPKVVVAAAAPKPVPVNLGSASVPNHDLHPAPVALGSASNPLAPSNRPATAAVNLGQHGLPGMSAGAGGGPVAQNVSLGSGQPNGSLGARGSTAVQGVKLGGVTNGTLGSPNGNGLGSRPASVQLGRVEPPPSLGQVRAEHPPVRSGPQVLFKPRPVYTAEATAMHLEGVVSIRIRVSSGGQVSVVGVTNGLGHGLDESAIHAVQLTRFRPAQDSSGNPTDWEGVVNISFQMAG